jgi:hypothetical protein
MTQHNSAVGYVENYTFESEATIYEIEAQSEKGRNFQILSSGPEKIQFLKENGERKVKEIGGRIMVPQNGAWRFYNNGQLEYMFRADDMSGCETELEKQCKKIKELDEKKAFLEKNATKIREWPERCQRKANLEHVQGVENS